MTTQEHAFRAYYASMTDAELLQTAANRTSFVDIAQRLLAEELTRRYLAIPQAITESQQREHARPGLVTKLIHKLRHLHFG